MAMVVCGATGSKEADEFGGLIKQYYTAWSTLDPDRAAPLYAKDADLVFFDIAPLKYSGGWQEYRDNPVPESLPDLFRSECVQSNGFAMRGNAPDPGRHRK